MAARPAQSAPSSTRFAVPPRPDPPSHSRSASLASNAPGPSNAAGRTTPTKSPQAPSMAPGSEGHATAQTLVDAYRRKGLFDVLRRSLLKEFQATPSLKGTFEDRLDAIVRDKVAYDARRRRSVGGRGYADDRDRDRDRDRAGRMVGGSPVQLGAGVGGLATKEQHEEVLKELERHPLYDRTIVAIESQLVDVSTIEDALFDILDASRPPEKRRKIAASSTATPVDAALPNGDGSAANKAAAQEPPVPATAPPPGTEASQAVEEGDHPMDVSLPLISPSVVVAENPSTVREASPGPPPTHPTDPAEPEDDPKEHDDEEMLDAQTSLVETQVHLDDDLRPTKYLDDDDEDISMADATVAVADHEPLIKEPTPLSEEPAKTLDSGLAVERSRRSKSTSTTPAPDTVGTEKAKRRTSRLPPPPTTSKQTDAATESNIGPTVERRITRGRLSTSLLPRDAEEDVVSPVDDIRSSGSGPSARRAEPVAVPERERRKTRVSIGLAKEPLSVSASSGKSPASQGFTSLPNAVKASEPSGGSGGERERRITRGSLSSSSTVPRDRDGTTSASTSPVETFKSRELPATAVEPLEEARKTRRTTIGSSATTLNPAGGNAKPPARLTRSSLGGSGARS